MIRFNLGWFRVINKKGVTAIALLRDKSRLFNNHPFHLVDPSPWPALTAFATTFLVTSLVLYFNFIKGGIFFIFFSLVFLSFTVALWCRDIVAEATFKGDHTLKVIRGIKIGFILFLLSEVMFFLSFFWAFFHFSLSPSTELGGVWPPQHLMILNPLGIPFLNTLILLTSGAFLTFMHACVIMQEIPLFFHEELGMLNRFKENSDDEPVVIDINGFHVTLFFAIIFLGFQFFEYSHSPFSISDGVYGSIFFLLTGFHGLHVIVGSIFIFISEERQRLGHFGPRHHLGFELSAWYWHFVDVVWIFLFFFVYVWGSWF